MKWMYVPGVFSENFFTLLAGHNDFVRFQQFVITGGFLVALRTVEPAFAAGSPDRYLKQEIKNKKNGKLCLILFVVFLLGHLKCAYTLQN